MYFLKKFIPQVLLRKIRPTYHGFVSWWANVWFGHPSDKLIVIGVTGTNGKSTTVNLTARILEEAGYKVGFTSTVNYKFDGQEMLNTLKMTMPSGWILQKWLALMVKNHCQYAVLEISSEGLAQNRHLGINFDVAVFTNLTPEHLESHGGFENYKHAKGKLFAALQQHEVTAEKLRINREVKKTIITNSDDEHSKFFVGFPAERYLSYGVNNAANFKTQGFLSSLKGVEFDVDNVHFHLQLKGRFDVYNSLAAIAVAQSQEVSLEVCKQALEKVPVVPGRMEIIQSEPFLVVVDYAYEPEEMRQLYDTISRWPHHRLIQVLGPTGGGRDKLRIPILGKMAAQNTDMVFVTMDDPYDDDPEELIQQMVAGAAASGKVVGRDLFSFKDRRGAIGKALHAAVAGDLVLITGKGADQRMALANGKYIEWDDRKVVREELGFKAMQDSKSFTSKIR